MIDVYAVEAIQNGEQRDVQVFWKFSDAVENMRFVKETGEDDYVILHKTKIYHEYPDTDWIVSYIMDYGFSRWDRIATEQIKEPARYTSTYWQHEADLPEGREGVHFLQILDPEGEEYAVIIHRTCNGQFPIGGRLSNEKLERAYNICEALNATL